MSLLVPKNRRPKFRVHLSIQDLTNVPLVSGLVHVRWHLRDSIRSEARGKTERSPIKDHKVEWGYINTWVVKMIIDKNNVLQDTTIEFEVYQEMYGGKERHTLGKLDLNLAEYADSSEEVSRRYLLQDSKVNSTLKLGLHLEQLSGDADFRVPEQKKQQVFGGITGLLAEGKEIKKRDDEMGFGPNHDSHAERVATQLDQDIYRNSIVRRWQAQAGELDPASVVDDIFAGSDGWTQPYNVNEAPIKSTRTDRPSSEYSTEEHHHQHHHGHDRSSSAHSRSQHHHHNHHEESTPQQDYVHRSQRNPQDRLEVEDIWNPERQAFEADEMLRSLTWSVDAARVEERIAKYTKQREQAVHA